MTLSKSIATLGAVALLVPAAAVAKGKPADAGSHGKAKGSHGKAKGKSKPATFVFKGTWNADGTVLVASGNSRGKQFEGQTLTFDWANAKFSVADTNADGKLDAADVTAGDKVVVKAKLARNATGTGPFAASKLVDQTHPQADEDEKTEAPEAPKAP